MKTVITSERAQDQKNIGNDDLGNPGPPVHHSESKPTGRGFNALELSSSSQLDTIESNNKRGADVASPGISVSPIMLISKTDPSRPFIMTNDPGFRGFDKSGKQKPARIQDYFYHPEGRPGIGKSMMLFLADPNVDKNYKREMTKKYEFLRR